MIILLAANLGRRRQKLRRAECSFPQPIVLANDYRSSANEICGLKMHRRRVVYEAKRAGGVQRRQEHDLYTVVAELRLITVQSLWQDRATASSSILRIVLRAA